MTRPNRHRVQRQIVELAVGASEEAPAVHRELARPFWDSAVAELERVFDGVAGPGELLRLDCLEIDLGNVDGVDWPAEFRRKLIAELARSLANLTVVSKARGENAGPHSQPAEPWQQFVFFLIHGRLPWWAATPAEGWTDLLQISDAAAWSALREAVFSHPHAGVRLVHSVTDEFLDTAIARWSGLRHAARALERWTPKGSRGEAHRRWRRAYWRLVIDWVSSEGFRSPRGGPELVYDLLTLRHRHFSESEQDAPRRSPPRGDSAEEKSIGTAPDGDLPEPWREWQTALGDASAQRASPEIQTNALTTGQRVPSSSPPRERAAAGDVGRRPAEQDEAIYLEGAGAILLHPFFEQLFRERGLLAERSFRDNQARDRAVHLIGLLTFGIVDVPEYQLVLPKAICGARFDEPLEPVELDDADRAACDALLRAVLEHWTALRSSSPAWLRQCFFLREGKLERVDSGYRLTIERCAQDVLLTRLPWGCGVVALPWLAERMFVRWLD